MNKTKKLLCMLVAVVMVFAVVACSNGKDNGKKAADVVGTYVAVDMTGEEIPEGMEDYVKEILKQVSLEIKEDGKAVLDMAGDSQEFDYKVEGDTIKLTADGETADAKIDGDKIVLALPEEAGGMSITFEKGEKAPVSTPEATKPIEDTAEEIEDAVEGAADDVNAVAEDAAEKTEEAAEEVEEAADNAATAIQ